MPLFESAKEVEEFSRLLPTQALGKRIAYYSQTTSTNDLALAAARAGAGHGQVFIADAQACGRGRRGRQWHSAPELGLLLSVVLRPQGLVPAQYAWLSLVAGLACVKSLERCGGTRAALKWPNDVVIPSDRPPGWRKLGGILCESALPADSAAHALPTHLIVGIGLNINHTAVELPGGTRAPATSVRVETGVCVDRRQILGALLENLERGTLKLQTQSGGQALVAEIQQRLQEWWQDKTLAAVSCGSAGGAPQSWRGSFAGLDPDGRLRLKVGDGEVRLADAEITQVGPG